MVSSHPVFPPLTECDRLVSEPRMSTPVLAYLDRTGTKSEPFEDPIDTETPETVRMAVRIPPAMSSGLSASMAEVATMSESTFLEDSEEDDDEEDEEIEESMDSYSVSEDAEDEGPTAEDKDPAAGDEDDESRSIDEEGHSVESDGLGLEEEEDAVPEGFGSTLESETLERVSASRQPTLATWTDPKDDIVYIDVPAYPPPAPPVQTPHLPE
ncbi:hypothetical protein Tco_1211243 [Tanacetum coccineum]